MNFRQFQWCTDGKQSVKNKPQYSEWESLLFMHIQDSLKWKAYRSMEGLTIVCRTGVSLKR